MAKDKLTEYDATAANNTVVGDVNLAENSALPSDMNNAVREIMSHQKEAFGSGTPLYVDQTNNRVGVREASPAAPLHVSTAASTTAEIRLTSNNTGSGSGDRGRIAVYSSRNDGTAYEAGLIDIDRSSGTEDKAHILFATNNGSGVAERLRIDSSGNVGIGTTSPTNFANFTSLDIKGGTSGALFNLLDDDGTRTFTLNRNDSDVQMYNLSNTPMKFFTNNTERMAILAGGGLTFNGDTAAANALDDYEEGTWTPVLRAETSNLTATYIEQVGRYVRVGKLVHVQSRMQGSVTNAGSGARFIDGLPYTNVNAGADTGSGSVCPFNGLMGNNYYFATGHGVNNAASFRLKIQTNLDGTLSDISSGTGGFAIDFSYTYRSQS